jgi:tetratricopeptide (TPR) repeat protein
LQAYKNAIYLKPEYRELYYDIGYTFSHLDSYDSAEHYLKKCSEIFSERKEVLEIRFYNFYRWGKYKEALITLDKILEINPRDTKAMFSKGIIHFINGRSDLARRCWETAYSGDPGNIQIKNVLDLLDGGRLKKDMFLGK